MKSCTIEGKNQKLPSLNLPRLLHIYGVVAIFEINGVPHTKYSPLFSGLIYRR